MKKLFGFILLGTLLLTRIFAAPMDSTVGYKDLQWETSLAMAKMAGYNLKLLDDDIINSEQKTYKGELKIYSVQNISDKAVSKIWFYFLDDKLVKVTERLNKSDIKEGKLAARYGKFNSSGIHKIKENAYSDVHSKDNLVTDLSIYIRVYSDYALVELYDWNTMIKSNRKVMSLIGKATISDELYELSYDLLKNTNKTKKISMAFIALSSDANNKFVENYVTDALTQAVFECGNIKIIERVNLEKILSEQKFQASGIVDDSSAKSIGKIAGVDYVCYGDMKDIGEEINVNARIVDVESGEVIAISRTTVKKDKYLKDYAKQQIEVARQKKIEETKKAEEEKKRVENLAWKVSKVRNDFDSETIYSFKCMNPDGTFLFFGYEKGDNPLNSRVRCSLYRYNGYSGVHGFSVNYWKDFDFKVDSGDILKINQNGMNSFDWDNNLGCNYDKRSDSYESIYKTDASVSKQFFDMFINSVVIYVRDKKTVRPFQTEGLLDVMTTQGITKEEIYKALGNESF